MAFIKFCSSYLFIDQSLSMTQPVKIKKRINTDRCLLILSYQALSGYDTDEYEFAVSNYYFYQSINLYLPGFI